MSDSFHAVQFSSTSEHGASNFRREIYAIFFTATISVGELEGIPSLDWIYGPSSIPI